MRKEEQAMRKKEQAPQIQVQRIQIKKIPLVVILRPRFILILLILPPPPPPPPLPRRIMIIMIIIDRHYLQEYLRKFLFQPRNQISDLLNLLINSLINLSSPSLIKILLNMVRIIVV